MKQQNQNDALIAAFLAKGGAVTKCAEGADSGISERDWYKAVRGEQTAVSRTVREDRDSEARYHALHDAASEARMNGHTVTGYDAHNVTIARNGRSVAY